jgi:hypothetical protein
MARKLSDIFFAPKDWEYKRKTAKDLSDAELKNKLCKGWDSQCEVCEVNDLCQYGIEHMKRKDKQ